MFALKAQLLHAILLLAPWQVSRTPERPYALQPGKAITQYLQDVWNTDAGLPQNSVFNISRTPDGYLWMATEEGAAKFDGVRFTVFTELNTPELSSALVRDLTVDGKGNVWIATNGGGLTRLSDGVFTSYRAQTGLASDFLRRVFADSRGFVWAGTQDAGLSRIAPDGRITNFTTADGLSSNFIRAIFESRNGDIWVGTISGLDRIAAGEKVQPHSFEAMRGKTVETILQDSSGEMWFGTNGQGLFSFGNGAFRTYTTRDGLADNAVIALYQDGNGTIWIGTNGGVTRLQNETFSSYGPADGLPAEIVLSFYEDPEGSLWIGTNGGGLARLRDSKFTTWTMREGLTTNIVLAILEDGRGNLWAGTAGGGLNVIRAGETRATSLPGLPGRTVIALHEGRAGGIWIGTVGGGLVHFAGNRLRTYTTAHGLSNNTIRAVLEDRQGRLWVGTNDGLNVLENGRFRSYSSKDGLTHSIIADITESADGVIWIATEGGGAIQYREGQFRTLGAADGLTAPFIHSIYEGKDGSVWIAAEGPGLFRYKNGRFSGIGARHGLCDDKFWEVLEDDLGFLWLTSNKGICRVAIRDIEALISSTAASIPATLFGKADGMRSVETNGGISPAGWKARDGSLWFPTVAGLARVDPRRMPFNALPPSVVVESVRVDNQLVIPDPGTGTIPRGSRFEFRYTALTFIAPAATRFRRKLEGFDEDWIDAETNRVADYTRLPPGRYTFRVIAANSDGVWNETGHSLSFELKPGFRETYWFYGLCSLIGLALVVGVHRLRVRGLTRRTAELLALIEKRREAEEALRRSEERYRELFENANDAVFITDLNGNLRAMNRKAEQITEWRRGMSGGAGNLLQLLHSDDSEAAAALLRKLVNGESVSGVCTVGVESAGGEMVRLEIGARVVLDESGQNAWVQWIGRDITEREQMEKQIRQSQKMEAIGRLAGGVAHDFNNLLTVILGYSEVLQEHVVNGESCRMLDEIKKASERGASLSQRLLAFSRQQALAPQAVDLNQFVTELTAMLNRLLREDVRLEMQLASDVGAVHADPGQLGQVIMNLVINARDAMPNGGVIMIATGFHNQSADTAELKAGRYARLRVSDNGTGMDENTRSRIFEPFFTTKEAGKGTGLGLSTVHGILKQSGGAIEVESEPGTGTTFTCYLPLSNKTEAAEDQTPIYPARAETGVILLVEDEEATRDLMSHILTQEFYTVLPAKEASEAQTLAAGHLNDIKLVISDVVLPGMRGPDLVRQLRSQGLTAPALFMSGYLEDFVSKEFMEPGDGFLQKPFSPDALRRKVHELLDAAPGVP